MSSDATRPENELLHLLVDNLSAMVVYWDASLRCRLANRAVERWFGRPAEAMIGKHFGELLGALYQLNLPHIEAALRGQPQQFERDYPDPAGGPPRHGLINYIPDVSAGEVRGFFALVTDISEVKRAQVDCAEAEERFRLTIDEAPIGMALVAPDGRFMRVNRALCEIVGYSAEELTGLPFQAITHPDDLDADLTLLGRLSRGEIPRYQLGKRYLRKDGAVIDIQLSVSVLRGPGGVPRHYIAQIEDVTERKRLEDRLRLAEAQASGILATAPDAIVSIDEAQRIILFNEGAERVFGYSRAEVLGASVDLLIPERFRAIHRRHVARFAAGPETARRIEGRGREIFGLRKDGGEFLAAAAISRLEVRGRRILTVAMRDVTEQRRREGEQRFLAEIGPLLATSLDYEETLTRVAELAVRDLADVCLIDLITEDERLLRLKVVARDPAKAALCEALMRMPLDRSRPHLMREVLETRRSKLLQRPSAETIAALSQSEEHRRYLEALGIRSMMTVPLQAPSRLLGAIALISSTPSRTYGPDDLRLAEELSLRAGLSIENARLYRTATLATQARDDVLGVVAHDLRNPLHSIQVHAGLLQRGGPAAGPRVHQSAAAIERAAARMNRLIQDLLDVTRMEAGRLTLEPTRAPAGRLLLDAAEAQRSLTAEAALELRLEAERELPEVWADRDRLLQIFENLVGNALKFTPAGGRITLGASDRGGEVLFWVADTGNGIAAGDLPHVFDRFWQAQKAQAMGAGLGLPIVKGLVEAHHGRIWVESQEGRGSTFYFTLPTAGQEAGRERPAPPGA